MIKVPPPGRIAIGTATVNGQRVEMFLTPEWARYFESLTNQSDNSAALLSLSGAIASMGDDSGSVMEFIPGPPGPAGMDGAQGAPGPAIFLLQEPEEIEVFWPAKNT